MHLTVQGILSMGPTGEGSRQRWSQCREALGVGKSPFGLYPSALLGPPAYTLPWAHDALNPGQQRGARSQLPRNMGSIMG